MYTASDAKKDMPVDMQLDGHIVSMQVDIGATVSMTQEGAYRRVLRK